MGPSFELVQIPLDGISSFSSVSCPTQLAVFCKLAANWISSTVSLIQILKSTHPKMAPWGTALIIGLHLDMEPLTSTLCLQSSNLLLIHQIFQPSNPYLSYLERRLCCKTMSKVLQKCQADDISWSSLSTDAIAPSWKAIPGLMRHDLPLVKLCCLSQTSSYLIRAFTCLPRGSPRSSQLNKFSSFHFKFFPLCTWQFYNLLECIS